MFLTPRGKVSDGKNDTLRNDAENIPRDHPHHPQIAEGVNMAIDKAMDRVLDDWGWWVRDRAAANSRCRSIEGRYRRERVPGDDEREPRREVWVDECLAVERAVCHPSFPAVARGLLKGWYVKRISKERIAGKLGIPRSAFEHELGRAVTMLKNRLDKLVLVSIIAATNPTDRDKSPPDGGVRASGKTQARQA